MSKFYSEMSSVPPPRIFWPLLYFGIAVESEIAAALAFVLGFIGPGGIPLSWNSPQYWSNI